MKRSYQFSIYSVITMTEIIKAVNNKAVTLDDNRNYRIV